MRKRTLALIAGIVTAIAVAAPAVLAQNTNPRFGVWKMKSNNPPPFVNIMTYEPHGEKGMKITVEATSQKGQKTKWSYVTNFDGQFMPVTGDTSTTDTSVEVIDERTNKITNRTNGKVTTVITNILMDGGNTIHNSYARSGPEGQEVVVSYAIYERVK